MIPNPTPVITDPVPSKTYDELWIYSLTAISPTVDSGRISIELLPYNRTLNELGPSDAKVAISTDRFFQALQEVPELAAAFNAVIAAVPATRAWIEAQQDNE